jgi:SAM-dependent methyltransferase
MGPKNHWERVYASQDEREAGWYQAEPALSLELIGTVCPPPGGTVYPPPGRVIDVGGGASVLVDQLLDSGFEHVAVLDISKAALEKAKARLGRRASAVHWIEADITAVAEIGTFDVWHDRAVFHFLTDAADRAKYVALAKRTLPPGGHLIMATFALDGPPTCSGLAVCRYDAASLAAELGDGFSLVRQASEAHVTPRGSTQPFFYGVFRRQGV